MISKERYLRLLEHGPHITREEWQAMKHYRPRLRYIAAAVRLAYGR